MPATHGKAGVVAVLSGPSGAGKTTVYRALLAERPGIRFSVSCTTRKPRQGEVAGRDYHFLSEKEFQRRVKAGDFLEHADVHGHRYGTLRTELEKSVEAGHDVLLDIDVQGARLVRRAIKGTPLDAQSLFVFCGPPSLAELERRLRHRGTDPEQVIQRRLKNAQEELKAWPEYEYVIVNRDVAEAVRQLAAVLDAFHCRSSRFNGEIWNHD